MNFSGAGGLGSGAAVSAYLSSLLAKTQAAPGAPGSPALEGGSKAADQAMKTASEAALDKAARGVKAAAGQRQLEHKATALGAELLAAMKSAGVTLAAPVSFSVSPQGLLAIKGQQQDAERVSAFLERDTGTPGLRARLAALTQEADALSQTIRQSAAISQAARHAASPAGVLALYGTLLQRQDAGPAAFTLGASGGTLSYPGMLQSIA